MNLKQMLNVGALGVGLTAFTACDTTGDVELASREYEGRCKITLTQNVRTRGPDRYALEVQDSTGTVIAYMYTGGGNPSNAGVEVSKGKTYSLRDGGVRLEK